MNFTKVALIGAGKMGISHLSILGAHNSVKLVGVSDTSKMVLDVLKKYSGYSCYTDYREMLDKEQPDAVFVSVPTKFHSAMATDVISRGMHVFSEKPLCLTAGEGEKLVSLVAKKGVVNQVGYHNKFIGTFQEVKRILDSGLLGKVFHFEAESYGPVVIRSKQDSWRSNPGEGGGCLMDYASHVIDLVHYLVGPITKVKGAITKSFYSKNVEDAVYALLEVSPTLSGTLSVNWSDETYRKMSTSVTIQAENGKIICDANEFKVFFRSSKCPEDYTKGWNIKYITDLTPQVDFYLRGEEYSAQIDHFVKAIQGEVPNVINDFKSAWQTDNTIDLIRKASTK